MTKPEQLSSDLSDRLLLMANTFRRAREGYLEFDHQQAKMFQEMLFESYEDALLLEAAVSLQPPRRPLPPTGGKVVRFPRQMRPRPDGGAA